ncbi:MAG: hypothetical protein GWP12_03285, partial [Nitrospirae bacterium]|nr:hypothetical protein [Nitrospirota bacterium]
CLEQQELHEKQSRETGELPSLEDFHNDALSKSRVERSAGREATLKGQDEQWENLDGGQKEIKRQEHGQWEGWDKEKADQEQKLLLELASSLSATNYYSVRYLSALLGVSKTEVSNSIKRSTYAGIAYLDNETKSPKVNKKILFNFLIHGIKYVFPPALSIMTRGIPTSFASPALRKYVESAGDLIYVWPDPQGKNMGQSVAPLFSSVPFAVRKDRQLYEYLALVDAIRLGNAREVNLARIQLEKGLLS